MEGEGNDCDSNEVYDSVWVGEILQLVNQLLEDASRPAERVYELAQCNSDLVYSLYSDLFIGQVASRPVGVYYCCCNNNIVNYLYYQMMPTVIKRLLTA